MKKETSFYHRWLSMVVFSVLLLGLVGYASDQTSGMFEVSIVAVIVLTSVFHLLFGSSSSFFNVVFANGMTIYLCFFTFFVESIFSRLPQSFMVAGFLMPLASFLAGAIYWRREIAEIVQTPVVVQDKKFAKAFLWLAPISLIGFAAFVLHQSATMEVSLLEKFFLGEMTMIAIIVFFASRDFSTMLMDSGAIFGDFFSDNAHLVKPVFAFFTFYSINIIVFAATYCSIERLSVTPHFMVSGVERDLTFVESMYFSLVTISTLGYGDIIPETNAVRFVVGLQTFLGTLLFLFGVHAILSHRKK